jgi:hypothetical protein
MDFFAPSGEDSGFFPGFWANQKAKLQEYVEESLWKKNL